MGLELGRSSFYAGCPVPNGIGEDSIYINVNGQSIVIDWATAARFIEAVVSVGTYNGLL